MKINDKVVETKEVSLGAKESKTVSFTVTEAEAGTYKVEIDGQVGSFTVMSAPFP